MTGSFRPESLRDAFGAFRNRSDGGGRRAMRQASQSALRPIPLPPSHWIRRAARLPCQELAHYESMTFGRRFAINVLSETQKDVSNTFARPVEDRFAAVDWRLGRDGCAIFFRCGGLVRVFDAGHHRGGRSCHHNCRVTPSKTAALMAWGYARGGYFTPRLAGKAVSAAVEGEIVSCGCSNSRARDSGRQ